MGCPQAGDGLSLCFLWRKCLSMDSYVKPSTRFGEKGGIRKTSIQNRCPALPLTSRTAPHCHCSRCCHKDPRDGSQRAPRQLLQCHHGNITVTQRGPKNCDLPQLDTWGRPTGQTPWTGQGQETEGEDDTGLGNLHQRVGPWPELRNMQPATPQQEQGAGSQAQSKWQSQPQRESANTSPSRERQQTPPGLDWPRTRPLRLESTTASATSMACLTLSLNVMVASATDGTQ